MGYNKNKKVRIKFEFLRSKKLLEMGLSLSEVAEATELAMKEVEQINRELTV